MANPTLRILFVSISDRPVLNSLTHARLRAYCQLHGYHSCTVEQTLCAERHIAWSKIPLLERLMQTNDPTFQHDLYVWIDDDIYITDMECRFEDLLSPYSFEHILMSQDLPSTTDEIYAFNSGIIVARKTAWTLALWQRIWDVGTKVPSIQWTPTWEQMAMNMLWRNDQDVQDAFCLIPHGVVQSYYRTGFSEDDSEHYWKTGDFAVHVTGMELEERVRILRENFLAG